MLNEFFDNTKSQDSSVTDDEVIIYISPISVTFETAWVLGIAQNKKNLKIDSAFTQDMKNKDLNTLTAHSMF